VLETVSLGIQQANRPLLESTLIAGLNYADAQQVILCRESKVELSYPPTMANPCTESPSRPWIHVIKFPTIGASDYSVLFEVNWLSTFVTPLVLFVLSLTLLLAVATILWRAQKRFRTDVFKPFYDGLNSDQTLSIVELDLLRRKNLDYNELLRKKSVSEVQYELSAQVAHDIRSPLAALNSVLGSLHQLPEQERILIRSAVQRIRDIANNLLIKYRGEENKRVGGESEKMSTLLSSLIEPLVSEKRLQFKDHTGLAIEYILDHSSYGLFAAVDMEKLKRMLSNLINNAVEAFGNKGEALKVSKPKTVKISLGEEENWAVLSISDNGSGIPSALIEKLGQKGNTFGKQGGSGLGLFHAKSCIEEWKGSFHIASQVGEGTTITLALPKSAPPSWFVQELKISPRSVMVIVDDDQSIHQVWKSLLNKELAQVHLYSPSELRDWIAQNRGNEYPALYLLDYEFLQFKETGLDLIEELNIGLNAILVTSRFEEREILHRCEKVGTKLIPKNLVSWVPIKFDEFVSIVPMPSTTSATSDKTKGDGSHKPIDVVLIDDEGLVRMMWGLAAQNAGKRLLAFDSAEAFYAQRDSSIDLSTPIYIDSQLHDGVRGEIESQKIFELGYTNIFLATGRQPDEFSGCRHLSGVTGKEPPF
jgi:signal transduction histidine kinase/CheY-like chemotaxis protein